MVHGGEGRGFSFSHQGRRLRSRILLAGLTGRGRCVVFRCARVPELVVASRAVIGVRNVRRRPRPGLPEWSSGPPEWSEDCARSGRGPGPGSFRPGCPRRVRPGCGASPVGPIRLVLEVLLWLVGRYSEQGVMLHVCKMVLRRRLFRMTWLKVGARRALRAVGGAWRDSATMC